MLQQFTYNIGEAVLCNHVVAILNFGGHIDFQLGVPIKIER